MPNETFAVFDTSEGKFKIKLFADKAPKTVENFTSLADVPNPSIVGQPVTLTATVTFSGTTPRLVNRKSGS